MKHENLSRVFLLLCSCSQEKQQQQQQNNTKVHNFFSLHNVAPVEMSLIITKDPKSSKNLTKHPPCINLTLSPTMQQAWNYRAHAAGKTNLQFSLSIPKPPVYCWCPLETEQTAVKMFKRLCFLRYLCSWIPIDCSYIKGVWWQGTTFRANREMLTPLVSSSAEMCLMPLRDVVWRRVLCMCGLFCQPV